LSNEIEDGQAPDETPQEIGAGDALADMVRKKYPELMKVDRRERIYDHAIGRISMIQHRYRMEGPEMSQGWLREYLMMRDVRMLIESLEQQDLEKKAEEDRKWKGKKR